MKKIIMMGAGALALIGISVGVSVFVTGALKDEPAAAAAVPEEELPPDEVHYYNIQPEFVVNFQGKSRSKFLMIEMVVATHDEKVIPVLDDHDPELRNLLLLLLAEQDSEVLKTAEGKQALREEARLLIDEMVGKHYIPEQVEEVFITRLVMQ